MKYDKETVVGVLGQIIKKKMIEGDSLDSVEDLEWVLKLAKKGRYSTPTLEEVWKEKAEKIRDTDQTQYYMFEHDGDAYTTRYVGGGEWCYPSKLEKL
jgi:hypothetical protein